ncbi:MAG TPA: carboxypeptidase regulatory-like domain-containing protein [Egibacteraceae bacterium]|nr:carboxypeptidase regulatory-like domain-containing protein [Egibacteraceae bacterium]
MNTHSMRAALPRLRPALAAAAALLMISTLMAAPAAADNHFRPLEAWNNFFQGTTDGLFVRWSEPITPNPPAPPSGYTIHTAADCSDPAISTGTANHWAPGRPDIRDLTMSNWAAIQTGETYYLRVAPGAEQSSATGALNTLECLEFVAELRAAITGRVTAADTGGGLPTATVTAYDADGNIAAQQAVVASSPNPAQIGNYSIEGLQPGTYTVTASAPGYQSESRTITAPAGQTPNVVFNLQPAEVEDPGAIAGTVTAADGGGPIAGATVTAGGESATTGGDGSYVIEGLAAGQYTVTANAAGYEQGSQTATVTEGQTTTADFALAAAPTTGCGAVITSDFTLTENIGPCADGGLFVQASGTEADPLVIDLGGHTISGVPGTPGNGAGILIDGQDHIVVRNGTIRDFDAGVAIDGGDHNHLEDLVIMNNIGSNTTDWGEGVAFGNPVANRASNYNTICNSIIRNNGPYAGIGVYGTGTTGNVIGDPACGPGSLPGVNEAGEGGNLIADNRAVPSTIGVRLEPLTNSTTVENNVVENNTLDGISIFSRSTDNVVRGNISRNNGSHTAAFRFGSGIIAFAGSQRNLIEDNTVTGNAGNGIFLQGIAGTQPHGSINNQVLNNTVVNNSTRQDERPTALMYDLHDANVNPPCDNNVWLGNIYGTFNHPCVTAGGLQVPAITGQVTDAGTGAPIPNATVTLVGPGTETSTVTTADGNYAFGGLEPGQYTVTVQADGYEPASQTATAAENEVTTVDVALVAEVEEPPPPPANPTTRDDCKNGGWQDYGFRNQGQCLQFVNTGKDSRP